MKRFLSISTVPAKPTNFKIASIREKGSKFQATLTWDKPTTTTSGITDSSAIKYYISYKVLKSGPNRQTQSPTERYSLGSLAAASTYQIKVRAFKTFKPEMVGDWSDPKILQTNESSKKIHACVNFPQIKILPFTCYRFPC